MESLITDASDPNRGFAELARVWFDTEVIPRLAQQGVNVENFDVECAQAIVQVLLERCGWIYSP